MYFIIFILLLFSSSNALPLDSCSRQSSQLALTSSSCNGNNQRNVCLSWNDGGDGVKSTADTISHVCLGNGGVKTEGWNTTTPICVLANGGR
jgi:hypothetical protein